MVSQRVKTAVQELLERVQSYITSSLYWHAVFVVNICGRVSVDFFASGELRRFWPLPEGLYLRLFVEELKESNENVQGQLLLLKFQRLRVVLERSIVEEGYYWEETRIENIYRIEPTDEYIVARALWSSGRLIPIETSQLERAIAGVIDEKECSRPVRL